MEENDFNFNTELLTLEDSSAIAVAGQILATPDLKNAVKSFLDKYYPCWRKKTQQYDKNLREEDFDILSSRITKILSPKWAHLDLPELLKNKVQNYVLEMCEKMVDWIMYLTQDLELDVEYVEKIYWTSNGLIDDDKIFKCYWMNFPVHKAFEEQRFDEKLKPLYYLAGFFGQEEFLTNFQTDVINEINSIVPLEICDKSRIVFSAVKFVIAYYHKFPIRNSKTQSEAVRFSITALVNTEILDICISLGLYKAFTFIWDRLNVTERYNYLEDKSKVNLKISVDADHPESLFQIQLFLMNEMDTSEKNSFIIHNFQDLFLMFLRKKPFQKFCIPLIDKFLPLLPRDDIGNSLKGLVRDFKCSADTNDDFHLQVLERFMARISIGKENILLSVLCDESKNSIFNSFNIQALKLIINDKDLQNCRNSMISCGSKKFKDLIQHNDFQILNKFMDEVLVSESERNEFKQDFNFLYSWFRNDDFDVADKVLYWMHKEQAPIVKKKLMKISCRFNTTNCLAEVELLLKWYFESQKEPLIDDPKISSKSLKRFCREYIYNLYIVPSLFIYMGKADPFIISAREKTSTKVLKSALGSEELILYFKKNELVKDEEVVRFYLDVVIEECSTRNREVSFDLLDSLFKFCLLPKEKIDAIKKSIADNIDDWIVKYGVRLRRYVIVVPLLDWIYGSKKYNYIRLKYHFENHKELIDFYNNRKTRS